MPSVNSQVCPRTLIPNDISPEPRCCQVFTQALKDCDKARPGPRLSFILQPSLRKGKEKTGEREGGSRGVGGREM